MIKYSLEELNPSDIAIYRILIGALFINIFVRAREDIVKTDNIKIDLISKNIEIFMNNKKDKVEITSKK